MYRMYSMPTMANIITVAGNPLHTFPYSPLLLLLHNSILLSRVLHQFSWGQQQPSNNIAEYNRLHVSKCNNKRKNFLWWCWLSCETTTVVVRKNIKKLTKDVKKWFRKWEYRHLWRRICQRIGRGLYLETLPWSMYLSVYAQLPAESMHCLACEFDQAQQRLII